MIGKAVAAIEKPVPLAVAPLTVTARLPVELRVTVCVEGVFRSTLPKLMLVALTLITAAAAFNCSTTLWVAPPPEASSVTVCAALTAVALAVNVADIAFAATATEAGTLTDALLAARLMVKPALGAGPFSPTVQVSLTVPVSVVAAQEKLLTAAVVVGGAAAASSCSAKLADPPPAEA